MPPESSTHIPLWGRGDIPVAYALIDSDDAPKVEGYRWNVVEGSGKRYAHAIIRAGGIYVASLRMHRLLLGEPPDSERTRVDHKNGDGLDNRRDNLRWSTPGENSQNRIGATSLSRSGIRGVRWKQDSRRKGGGGRWVAEARLAGHSYQIGSFPTKEAAACAITAWRREHMPFSAPDTDTARL